MVHVHCYDFPIEYLLLDPRFIRIVSISVCPSAHTSIFHHSTVLRISSLVFLYFAWSWGPISTKNLKVGQKAQNSPVGLSARYYSVFLRISLLIFLIFCLKLMEQNYAKLTQPNFLGEFSLARKRVFSIFPSLQHFSQDWLQPCT